MQWEMWLDTWQEHARTEKFARRLDLAVKEVQAHDRQVAGMFAGCSGGKDSCAVAGILSYAGLLDKVPLVYCHTELDTPGSSETVEALADVLNADLDVVESPLDIWDWLRAAKFAQGNLIDFMNYKLFLHRFSSVNLSVAHMYETGASGVFLGLRTEESHGRRMNRAIRGKLYRGLDGTWKSQPIVDWEARDVFALAVSMRLPVHPYYRLALERLGVSPESPGSRVGCMMPEETAVQWPVLSPLKVLYPDLWLRLRQARPELERWT